MTLNPPMKTAIQGRCPRCPDWRDFPPMNPSHVLEYLSAPTTESFLKTSQYHQVDSFLQYLNLFKRTKDIVSIDFHDASISERIQLFFQSFDQKNAEFFDQYACVELEWMFYILYLTEIVDLSKFVSFLCQLEDRYIISICTWYPSDFDSFIPYIPDDILRLVSTISKFHQLQAGKRLKTPFSLKIKDERYALLTKSLDVEFSPNSDLVVCIQVIKKEFKWTKTNFQRLLVTLAHCQQYKRIGEEIEKRTKEVVSSDHIQSLHLEQYATIDELKDSRDLQIISLLIEGGFIKSINPFIVDLISCPEDQIALALQMISSSTETEVKRVDTKGLSMHRRVIYLYYLLRRGDSQVESVLGQFCLYELLQFIQSKTYTPLLCLLVDQCPHLFIHPCQKPSVKDSWKESFFNDPLRVSIATVNEYKKTNYTSLQIYRNLLLLFQGPKIPLEKLIPLLDYYMIASRKHHSKELEYALMQESAAIQLLMETQDQRIYDFIHQKFCATPVLARMVHLQTYPLEWIPSMVNEIDSMHVCIDFLPEILNSSSRKIFGFVLLSHLLIKYPIPKYFDLSVHVLSKREFIQDPTWIESFDRFYIYFPSEVTRYLDELSVHFPNLLFYGSRHEQSP